MPPATLAALTKQFAQLQAEAPPDPTLHQALQRLAPTLYQAAQSLGELTYYILQSPTGAWETMTLSSPQTPHQTKVVIYAYGNLAQATTAAETDQIPTPIDVIRLLFQFVSLDPVDSVIFFPATGGNLGQEIKREDWLLQVNNALAVPPNLA